MSILTELGIIPYNEQYKSADTEPVAWMVYTKDGQSAFVTENPTDIGDGQRALPLYTAPPHRQPLTDKEMQHLWNLYGHKALCMRFARAIEAAHEITGENKFGFFSDDSRHSLADAIDAAREKK